MLCGIDFLIVFENLLERCEHKELELFAVVARYIWLGRNGMVHGEAFVPPNQLMRESIEALDDFRRANMREEMESHQGQGETTIKWQPPLENMVKIN